MSSHVPVSVTVPKPVGSGGHSQVTLQHMGAMSVAVVVVHVPLDCV